MYVQLGDLQLIPEKCKKDLSALTEQLDALNNDKLKEEQHLQDVMDSFKSETEASRSHTFTVLCV